MSDERVDVEFIARQLGRVIDDIASLKDDMGVLTAMVVRLDQEFGRLNAKLDDMFNQMRAMGAAASTVQRAAAGPRRGAGLRGWAERSEAKPITYAAVDFAGAQPTLRCGPAVRDMALNLLFRSPY